MAVAFAMYFGIMRAMALQPAAVAPANFVWNTMWVLAAGSTVLGFISDRTQDHALGDGHLLLIASSVISSALWSGGVQMCQAGYAVPDVARDYELGTVETAMHFMIGFMQRLMLDRVSHVVPCAVLPPESLAPRHSP